MSDTRRARRQAERPGCLFSHPTFPRLSLGFAGAGWGEGGCVLASSLHYLDTVLLGKQRVDLDSLKLMKCELR